MNESNRIDKLEDRIKDLEIEVKILKDRLEFVKMTANRAARDSSGNRIIGGPKL